MSPTDYSPGQIAAVENPILFEATSSLTKNRDDLAGQQLHRRERCLHGHPAPERPEDEVIHAEPVPSSQQLTETVFRRTDDEPLLE